MSGQISDLQFNKAVKIIGNSWALLILHKLSGGSRRFGELYRAIDGITQKMLTQKLRDLEREGLLSRKVYAEVPPKVVYSLTGRGDSFKSVLGAIGEWSVGLRLTPAAAAKAVKKPVDRKEPKPSAFDPAVD